MSVTQEPDRTAIVEALEVDWFGDTITVIQLMDLSRSTREDIDAGTKECVEHLNVLLGEELGAEQDEQVRALSRQAYKNLDMSARPTPQTSAYDAFMYMRNTATITFALLKVYVARNGAEDQ